MSLNRRLWIAFLSLLVPIAIMALLFYVVSERVVSQASKVRDDDVPAAITFLKVSNSVRGMQSSLHDYLAGEASERGNFHRHLSEYKQLIEELRSLESLSGEQTLLTEIDSLVQEYELTTRNSVFDVYSPEQEQAAIALADHLQNSLGREIRQRVVAAAARNYRSAQERIPASLQQQFDALYKYVELAHFASDLTVSPRDYVAGKSEGRAVYAESRQQFEQALQALQDLPGGNGGSDADLLNLSGILQQLENESQGVFEQYDPLQKTAALQAADKVEDVVLAQVDNMLAESVAAEGQEAGRQLDMLVGELRTFRVSFLILVLIATVFGVIAFLFSIRSISSSFSKVVDYSDRIVAGDYTTDLSQTTGPPEVKRVYSALQEMVNQMHEKQQRSESASALKTEFLANMSHEIRTPMNSIIGYAQLLLKKGELQGKEKSYVETIAQSGHHLLNIVNDVLDVSKIESGRTELRNDFFETRTLSQYIESTFATSAKVKGIELSIVVDRDVPEYIVQDAGKIQQILVNLVGNAVKFTSEGAVSLRISKQQNEMLFDVNDTGPGVSAEQQERLFTRFEKGANDGEPGTGLGLAISKTLSDHVGGQLDYLDKAEQGSLFRLRIPYLTGVLQAPSVEPPPDEHARPDTDKVPDLLIVDDSKENRELLAALLSLHFESSVRFAESGLDAVSACEAMMPDLIFMDVRMPQMNGLEATQKIRQLETGANVPIVVVSAGALEEEQKNARDAGVSGFLKKPIMEEELLEECRRFLAI